MSACWEWRMKFFWFRMVPYKLTTILGGSWLDLSMKLARVGRWQTFFGSYKILEQFIVTRKVINPL
jgi:hypothetical protein